MEPDSMEFAELALFCARMWEQYGSKGIELPRQIWQAVKKAQADQKGEVSADQGESAGGEVSPP